MARYIDADALTEELKSLTITVTGFRGGKCYFSEIVEEYKNSILRIIDEQATADVVPKSEVERLSHKCDDCAGCTQWKCDCANIELEVAREIFEEIERVVDKEYNHYVFNSDLDSIEQDAIINFSDTLSNCFAELKKKYTEGGDKDDTSVED